MTKKRAFAEGTHEPRTLRDRAEATKASAKRVVRRDSADQPSQETLPPESSGGQRNAGLPVNDRPAHGAPQGLDGKKDRGVADDRRQPKGEADMGRHETFANATPIAADMLAGTILGHTATKSKAGESLSLGEACAWAATRRIEIDKLCLAEEWGDERLDEECAPLDAIIARAISEPSSSLGDVAGKARLALEDYERFTAVPGTDHDDGERLVLTVLREIANYGDRGHERRRNGVAEFATPDPRSYSDQLSLSDEPMQVLRSLSDIASTISEITAAITCQPRCEATPKGTLNAAGQFADWIHDCSNWMLDTIRNEARSRSPNGRWDRETRLQILASATVDNGDPEEMFALARELAAEAACHG